MHRLAARGGRSYILPLAFGTTVLMWAIGYVSRIPPAWVPSPLLAVLLLLCLIAGGYVAGSRTSSGFRSGLEVGLVAGLLNLLVLGSLLTGGEGSGARSAWIWIPGFLAVAALLGAVGALFGRSKRPDFLEVDWTAVFAFVGASATFCLIVIGGLVTSKGAGLDVPDWPSSFGYNMFLYPLSRMSGGIYFEHSHRLFGSLVGLTTLVLTLHLLRVEPRLWVRWTAVAAFMLVVTQGILGGFRVTTATITATAVEVTNTSETARSLVLRVVHGVTGQLFFATMVSLAAFSSRSWKSAVAPTSVRSAPTDHALTAVLVVAIMIQLVIGALLRHISTGLFVHIGMATIVLVLAVATGARAAGLPQRQPLLVRLGKAVLWVVSLQVVLGIVALTVRGLAAGVTPVPAYKVILTTLHQATGALLLGVAVLLAVWSRRLLRSA
jgi:heme A synthase